MEIKGTRFGLFYIIKDEENWIILSKEGKEVLPPTKGTVPLEHQFRNKAEAEKFLELYQRRLVDSAIAAGKIPDVLADNLQRMHQLRNKDGQSKDIDIYLTTTSIKPEDESFGTANLSIVSPTCVTELMEITPKDLRTMAHMFKEFADRIDQLTEEQTP